MRLPDWESRLDEALKVARKSEFDARMWNCAQFARHTVIAISGRDIPSRWLGSLEASADAVLTRVHPHLAGRGDVVLADVPQPSLGVCVGLSGGHRRAAFVTAKGLTYFPMSKARIAWRV